MTEIQARLQEVISKYLPYAPGGVGVVLKTYLPGIIQKMPDESIKQMVAEIRRLTEYVETGNLTPGGPTPGGYPVEAQRHQT